LRARLRKRDQCGAIFESIKYSKFSRHATCDLLFSRGFFIWFFFFLSFKVTQQNGPWVDCHLLLGNANWPAAQPNSKIKNTEKLTTSCGKLGRKFEKEVLLSGIHRIGTAWLASFTRSIEYGAGIPCRKLVDVVLLDLIDPSYIHHRPSAVRSFNQDRNNAFDSLWLYGQNPVRRIARLCIYVVTMSSWWGEGNIIRRTVSKRHITLYVPIRYIIMTQLKKGEAWGGGGL
jgi:hypothetical protein